MEEKLKTSPLKKRYDDAILEGAFEGAYLTKRYENIIRIDGHSNEDFSIRDLAMDLAKEKDTDGTVAGGIATAILDSIIIYGDIGEKFLKEKLQQEGENFSREEYAVDVAKSITSLYQYNRKEKVINGVVDALNNVTNNIEANAAKTAIMENEYWNETRYSEADVLEERFLNGNVISIKKVYQRLETMHHKEVSKEQAIRNLNIAYQYLSSEYEQLSPTFKEQFEGLSKNKILAYYIANLQDSEMERVLKLAKEENNLDER